MPTRVALDTNVLAYAEGLDHAPGDAAKGALGQALVAGFRRASQRPVLATQALAELHRSLIRIARYSPAQASEAVRSWQATGEMAPLSADGFEAALTLAADHNLRIFDAMIMATAVEASCDLLVSEDMQDGFVWRGLTVTNLFGDQPDPRLRAFVANLP
jgi:predicted nucleic acid-binding protein